MELRKTATALAMSAALGIATAGGALAQGTGASGNASGGGNTNSLTGSSQALTGSSGTGTNAATTTPRATPDARPDTMQGRRAGMTDGRYHWWQKEWWQQRADAARQPMPADDATRAFGDETTVAPSAAPTQGGSNDAGHTAQPGTMGGPAAMGSAERSFSTSGYAQ